MTPTQQYQQVATKHSAIANNTNAIFQAEQTARQAEAEYRRNPTHENEQHYLACRDAVLVLKGIIWPSKN